MSSCKGFWNPLEAHVPCQIFPFSHSVKSTGEPSTKTGGDSTDVLTVLHQAFCACLPVCIRRPVTVTFLSLSVVRACLHPIPVDTCMLLHIRPFFRSVHLSCATALSFSCHSITTGHPPPPSPLLQDSSARLHGYTDY
jgi:hypothetical protein